SRREAAGCDPFDPRSRVESHERQCRCPALVLRREVVAQLRTPTLAADRETSGSRLIRSEIPPPRTPPCAQLQPTPTPPQGSGSLGRCSRVVAVPPRRSPNRNRDDGAHR